MQKIGSPLPGSLTLCTGCAWFRTCLHWTQHRSAPTPVRVSRKPKAQEFRRKLLASPPLKGQRSNLETPSCEEQTKIRERRGAVRMFSRSKRSDLCQLKTVDQVAWVCILAEGLKCEDCSWAIIPKAVTSPGWLKTARNISSPSSVGQKSKIMVSRAAVPPEALGVGPSLSFSSWGS